MSNTPQPDQTPHGPSYEGRLLHRPDEDVVDQGARFDIQTVLSRRRMLAVLGLGAGGATLLATGGRLPSAQAAGATIAVSKEIPDETAGPYPADGSNGPDFLLKTGIVRSDIRSNLDGSATADGVPLTFSLQIVDMANGNVPFAGVAVYAWHCDSQGRYSMYSSGVESYTYLRGVQVADEDGIVTFTSIYPACYSGRWPHIHFEVYPDLASVADATNAIATSQIAMPDSANKVVFADSRYSASVANYAQISLATDNVFSDDSGASQLPAITGNTTSGYTATLVAGVDTTTTPTSGSAPGGAPGGTGAGPGGPTAPPTSGTTSTTPRTTSTTLRLVDHTVRSGRRPVVRLKVGPAAAGTVRILVDGKAVRTVSVSAADAGAWIRVRLPRASVGIHHVRAHYRGGGDFASSSSAVKRYRVEG